MLQIITYLLCIYLVFKAVEIFQIGLASDGKYRILARVIGIVAIVASIMFAVHFATAIDQQAKSVSGLMMRNLR